MKFLHEYCFLINYTIRHWKIFLEISVSHKEISKKINREANRNKAREITMWKKREKIFEKIKSNCPMKKMEKERWNISLVETKIDSNKHCWDKKRKEMYMAKKGEEEWEKKKKK